MTYLQFARMSSHLESVNQIILDAIGKWSTQEYVYAGIRQGDLTTFLYTVNLYRDPFHTTGLKTFFIKVPLEFFDKSDKEVQEIINKIPKKKLLIKGDILDVKKLIEEVEEE